MIFQRSSSSIALFIITCISISLSSFYLSYYSLITFSLLLHRKFMARGVKLFIDSYPIGSPSPTSQQFSTIFQKTTTLKQKRPPCGKLGCNLDVRVCYRQGGNTGRPDLFRLSPYKACITQARRFHSTYFMWAKNTGPVRILFGPTLFSNSF